MAGIFGLFERGGNGGEIKLSQEYSHVKRVVIFPINRDKTKVFLFQRTDDDKRDGKKYWAAPSGGGVMEDERFANDPNAAARQEFLHTLKTQPEQLTPLGVDGINGIWYAFLDVEKPTVHHDKVGAWFSLENDLPRQGECYKEHWQYIKALQKQLKRLS